MSKSSELVQELGLWGVENTTQDQRKVVDWFDGFVVWRNGPQPPIVFPPVIARCPSLSFVYCTVIELLPLQRYMLAILDRCTSSKRALNFSPRQIRGLHRITRIECHTCIGNPYHVLRRIASSNSFNSSPASLPKLQRFSSGIEGSANTGCWTCDWNSATNWSDSGCCMWGISIKRQSN